MNIDELIKPNDRVDLAELTAERLTWLDRKPFVEAREALADLPDMGKATVDGSEAWVRIGEDLSPDDPNRKRIERAARALIPWKKGPFRLFGLDIDAEWRSDFKWDRFAHKLPDQGGKRVLDVGGNNGYFLFRLLPQEPEYLLCIDPIARLQLQFQLLQSFASVPHLDFRMWGWEQCSAFNQVWDTIFNMGILYHHTDPIAMLRLMREALKPGGLLVLESIVIPGEDSQCLFPPDRYARMRNVWFVPTVTAMRHMLERARFVDIEVIAVNKHEPAEQRSTEWNPGPSYEAFIMPDHPDRTIEDLPAPYRAIIFARKKK